MDGKAIIEGLKNYNNDTDIPYDILKKVSVCENVKDSPIKLLRLKDRYPETNGKICGKCWCPLPTKLRQNIEICPCLK